MEIFEKVKEIIIDELGVDAEKITLEADFKEDLGADSIDAVSIIMALEDEYGITIDTDDANAVKTVGNIVEYIKNATK